MFWAGMHTKKTNGSLRDVTEHTVSAGDVTSSQRPDNERASQAEEKCAEGKRREGRRKKKPLICSENSVSYHIFKNCIFFPCVIHIGSRLSQD